MSRAVALPRGGADDGSMSTKEQEAAVARMRGSAAEFGRPFTLEGQAPSYAPAGSVMVRDGRSAFVVQPNGRRTDA